MFGWDDAMVAAVYPSSPLGSFWSKDRPLWPANN